MKFLVRGRGIRVDVSMLMGDGSQLTWDVNKFNDANNDGDNDSDNDDTLQMVTSTGTISSQSNPDKT